MSTSDPTLFNDGSKSYDFLASVFQQGGGIINPLRALQSTSIPSIPFLSLNDTASTENWKQGSIGARNSGSQPVRYDIGTSTAVTILAFTAQDNQTITPWTRTNDSITASQEFLETLRPGIGAQVRFENDQDHVILQPGEGASIKVTLDLSQLTLSRNRCPLYGGYITLQSNDTTSTLLRIPFGGLACSLQDITTIKADGLLSYPDTPWFTSLGKATIAESNDPVSPLLAIPSNTTFRLPGPASVSTNSTSGFVLYPTVILRLGMLTKEVTVDVLPYSSIGFANATSASTSTSTGLGFSNAAFSEKLTRRPGGFTRVFSTYWPWTGQLANGTWVGADTYFFRVCAFKPLVGVGVGAGGRGKDCIDTVSFNLTYY